jgi:hypothetical protein
MENKATQLHRAPTATSPSLLRSLRFWIPAAICMLALAAVPVAFVIGVVLGNVQIYQNLSNRQQARIEEFLSKHPDAFGHVRVEHASNGWAYPTGTVLQQSDYDLLADKLRQMFGDELAELMLTTVDLDAGN